MKTYQIDLIEYTSSQKLKMVDVVIIVQADTEDDALDITETQHPLMWSSTIKEVFEPQDK